MSRSGYSDDCYGLELGRWRAQVASTIRGKKGQAFLRELIAALDALPEKRLIASDLEHAGNVCAIGSVGLARGIDMSMIDAEDPAQVAAAFGITHQLAAEIEFMNDEAFYGRDAEERWRFMRNWAVENLRKDASA